MAVAFAGRREGRMQQQLLQRIDALMSSGPRRLQEVKT
jgi:hypothetical protein